MQLGKLIIAFEMVLIQNYGNLLVAMLLLQSIIPCVIRNQNICRPVRQIPQCLEMKQYKNTDPEDVPNRVVLFGSVSKPRTILHFRSTWQFRPYGQNGL